MFGELDDSDIYENGRGNESFGVPSGNEEEQNGYAGSFSETYSQQNDIPQFQGGFDAEESGGVLGAGYDSSPQVNDVQPQNPDPFSDSQRIQNMKPKTSSGMVYLALLLVLFVAAAGLFAYKKFVAPSGAPTEQSMGDMFYDQANLENPNANAQQENTATVDVDLNTEQTPAAQGDVQNAQANQPEQAAADVIAKDNAGDKPLSSIEKAMAKKKADEAKMNKLVPDKSVLVAVNTGGRADPFLPYGAAEALKNKPKFDIIAPPLEIPESDPVVDEVLQTKISGIMYDQNRPSAIVNFGDADQLVHKGDTVKGLKILDITKNTVVIKYNSNIYQATVGQTLDSGVNLNPVSGLNKQFGGAYGNASKNVIQFND